MLGLQLGATMLAALTLFSLASLPVSPQGFLWVKMGLFFSVLPSAPICCGDTIRTEETSPIEEGDGLTASY